MKDAGAQSIELVPLQIRKDRKHYIVEDVLQHEYYEMPKICIDAIKMLQEGKEPQEIEPLLKSRYPKEDVDMDAFMAQLWELRLLRRWNGRQQEIVQRSAKQSWGSRFSPWLKRLGSMMFHPVAIIIYISLFLYNVLQIIMTEKAPVYQDLFATDSMMVNMLSYSLLGLVAAVLHECGHTLAVAAKGLRFKWTIGHRLFIPVIETEMNEVWSLPSKSRYVPYLAGMCVDQVLLFVCFGLQSILPAEAVVIPWLRLLSLHLVLSFGYQLLFFMKTDLYYVVENATGTYNLMENAKHMLKRLFSFRDKQRSEVEGTVLYHGEIHIVRLYSVLYAFGVTVSIVLLMLYILPQMSRAIPADMATSFALANRSTVLGCSSFLCTRSDQCDMVTLVMVAFMAYESK